MKNQLPTFEEFRSETKKKLKLSLSHLNDKELEKFMDSEVDEIRESYERNKKLKYFSSEVRGERRGNYLSRGKYGNPKTASRFICCKHLGENFIG